MLLLIERKIQYGRAVDTVLYLLPQILNPTMN